MFASNTGAGVTLVGNRAIILILIILLLQLVQIIITIEITIEISASAMNLLPICS